MPTIEGAGVPLHTVEAGDADAPAAVVVHGLASDAAQHAPLVGQLVAAGLRVVAYDRRGYGASGAPEPYTATTVEEQAEDLIAVVAATVPDGQALLVGDGFGALIVLDVLKRQPALARAAVLGNPPLLQFVPEATASMAAQRLMLEEALREGGPRAGVAAWLGGRVDDATLARAQDAHLGFFADYAGLASWPVTRAELRAVAVPIAVVTGPFSPPPIVAAADRVAELVPGALRTTDGDLAVAARILA